MRPIQLGRINDIVDVRNALREIENASNSERLIHIADNYSVSNVTETRTLDVSTATATDVANVLATLILDMKRGGRVGQ